MEEIYIKKTDLNNWIAKRFPNTDMIPLSLLLGDYEDVLWELDQLEERNEELKDTIRENTRDISPYSMYGVSERDFH